MNVRERQIAGVDDCDCGCGRGQPTLMMRGNDPEGHRRDAMVNANIVPGPEGETYVLGTVLEVAPRPRNRS